MAGAALFKQRAARSIQVWTNANPLDIDRGMRKLHVCKAKHNQAYNLRMTKMSVFRVINQTLYATKRGGSRVAHGGSTP